MLGSSLTAPPEPPKSVWDRFNLPPSAWTIVPVTFIEILILLVPSASLPEILYAKFDNDSTTVSIVTGVADTIGGILAFVLSPYFGKWSDTLGRKKIVLWMSLVGFLPIACLALYPYLNLWFYLSSRAFGKISALGILFSCVSDVAPSSQRARLFGQTTGLGMAAMVVGPLISLQVSTTIAFRLTGGLALVVLFYIVFLLPETLWIGLKRVRAEKEEAEAEAAARAAGMDLGAHNIAMALSPQAEGSTSGGSGSSSSDSASTDQGRAAPNDTLRTSLLSAENESSDAPSKGLMQPRKVFPSVGRSDDGAEEEEEGSEGEGEGAGESDPLSPDVLAASLSFAVPAMSAESDPVIYVPSPGPSDSEGGGAGAGAASRGPSMNPITAMRLAMTNPSYRDIALVVFFSQLSANGVMGCAMLYLRASFHFTKNDNSIFMLSLGGWSVVVMMVIMPLLLRRLTERGTLLIALVADFAHQIVYLFMPNKQFMFLLAGLQGFGMMSYPASNVVLSRCVGAEEQGAVLSMSGGIRSLTQGMAPVLFNGLFAYFTWGDAVVFFPQAPFCLSALFMAIAIFFCLRMERRHAAAAAIAAAAAAAAAAGGASDTDMIDGPSQQRQLQLRIDAEKAAEDEEDEDEEIQYDESPFVGQVNTLQA